MDQREPMHRLTTVGPLCGERGPLSAEDAEVTCATCRALLQLAAQRRRSLIRRSVRLIAPLANA